MKPRTGGLLLGLGLLIAAALPARADVRECLFRYYQERPAACVGQVLDAYEGAMARGIRKTLSPDLVGFFAEYFRLYPNKRAAILERKMSFHMAAGLYIALCMAKLPDEAARVAKAGEFTPEELRQLGCSERKTLADYKVFPNDSNTFNMMIGAFWASGNTDFPLRSFSAFGTVSEGQQRDAVRFAYLISHWRGPIGGPERDGEISVLLCQRYGCTKGDLAPMVVVRNIGFALQELVTMSDTDKRLAGALRRGFASNKVMAEAFVREDAAFALYRSKLPERASNEAVAKALDAYEKLAPLEEAFLVKEVTVPSGKTGKR